MAPESRIFAKDLIPHTMRHIAFLLLLSACAGLLPGCSGTTSPHADATTVADTLGPPPPAPAPPRDHAAFKARMDTFLLDLQALPDHALMDEISTRKLFAYFSGHIPSMHPFPVIYLDRAAAKVYISHKAVADSFPASQLDDAIDGYVAQLRAHGYVVNGEGGDDMEALSLEGLFPDESETAKFFKPAQLEFLHNNVSASAAFAYLAGVGTWGRGLPMMAGVGYEATARLWVMGPGVAEEYPFQEADSAFASWKALVAAP